MAQGPYSRIVIRRPDGRTEVITRRGTVDPNEVARAFAAHGTVIAVRHEQRVGGDKKPSTLAIHRGR